MRAGEGAGLLPQNEKRKKTKKERNRKEKTKREGKRQYRSRRRGGGEGRNVQGRWGQPMLQPACPGSVFNTAQCTQCIEVDTVHCSLLRSKY